MLYCIALWAHDVEIDGIYYRLDTTNKTASVTYKGAYYNEYDEYSGSVTIPETITYNSEIYSVTSIGGGAFYRCWRLTSVTIPNSVTYIAPNAFYDCSGLTSVTIPNSVTSIGSSAFSGCSGLTSVIWNAKNCEDDSSYSSSPFYDIRSNITSFTFGNEVEHIPAYLCYGMSKLTEITIPNSVTSIGEYAFYGCSGLTEVTIPNSVTSIGEFAFSGCSRLTSVTIPNSVTSIAYYAFSYCSGLTSVTIGESVTSIGGGAFYGCSGLTSVTIPNSVTSIGSRAFSGCSRLTSVTIPNSVTSIGYEAFYGCSGLTEVTIPNSVTSIGDEAFYNCSRLTSVIWNAKNCEDFEDYDETPFYNIRSSITSFTFGNEVEHIPAYLCYEMRNLKEVTIGNSVTSIGDRAFDNCSGLTKVNYLGTVDKWVEIDFNYSNHNPTYYAKDLYINNELLTDVKITTADSIKNYAFYNCQSIKSVEIGESITSISSSAFYGCSGLTSVIWNAKNYKDINSNLSSPFYNIRSNITSFTFGNEVEHIPAYLCYGMENLKEVTIGNSVTSIGRNAFNNCSGLTKVNYLGTVDKWVEIDFNYSDSNPTYCAKDLYINNELLADVKITTADSIKKYAFYNCQSIKSAEIGNSVTSIGWGAFSGCSGLTSVTIPNSVTSIDWSVFSDCSGLTEVTIPNSVTYIGSSAFSGCSGLTSVTISNSVKYIDPGAFSDCSGLTSVTIPNSVTYIGSGAFEDCSGLTSVAIPNNVTQIYGDTFKNCSELKSVSIGESVNTIGAGAFAGCDNLKKITMYPMNVPSTQGTETFAHYNAYLYVPCAVYEDYDLDDVFGNFKYIKCIAATEVDAPDKVEIDVDNDNNATITWPSTDGAKSYELEITKNGKVFCTLLFNEDGQLTSIDFGNRSASVGFQFTVTGLNGASKYNYSMVAMDKKGNELQSYKGTFTTNGYVPGPGEEDEPSAIIETLADANITVSSGIISADKEFSIYNTLGKDVTALNGSLQPGIYVVVLGEDRVKVMVK